MLQIECVCKTAEARRLRAMVTCSSASAEGLPGRLSMAVACGPTRTMSLIPMAPFETALAVMASVNGSRDTRALKLPLVPRTHPRV